MTSQVVRVAMVAGEASGDLLASHLIQALKARILTPCFMGLAGRKCSDKVSKHGILETLAVRGYVEVLKHYREISGIRSDRKVAAG